MVNYIDTFCRRPCRAHEGEGSKGSIDSAGEGGKLNVVDFSGFRINEHVIRWEMNTYPIT
jgi:hypothetical protein